MTSFENKKLRMEVPYFQCANDIFDLDFIVKASKRLIHKQNNKCTYEYVIETRALKPYEKLVYCYLARCCNNGKTAFPKYSTIADKCGFSERAAKEAIKVLYDNKFILKENQDPIVNESGQIKGRSNAYLINPRIDRLSHNISQTEGCGTHSAERCSTHSG